jgi:hypothetical protein
MLSSFSANNFRGFRAFRVDGLRRVNLITGQNNVGKTALLEALFLYSGHFNPSLPLTVNAMRGIERFPLRADEVWGWLFLDKRLESPIDLKATDDSGEEHRVRITCKESASTTLEPDFKANGSSAVAAHATPATGPSELALTYSSARGPTRVARALLEGGGIKIEAAENVSGRDTILLSLQAIPSKEDAERYSRLAEANRQQEVVEALKTIEPRLRGLEVLVSAEVPTIYADVGIGRKIPVRLVGAGTSRVLSIVLALLSVPQGCLLLDEIENGIHHTALEGLWHMLDKVSRATNVQVFATTHSWETVVAAHRSFSTGTTYDLAVHRLDRRGDRIEATTYDRETLDAAVLASLEVR